MHPRHWSLIPGLVILSACAVDSGAGPAAATDDGGLIDTGPDDDHDSSTGDGGLRHDASTQDTRTDPGVPIPDAPFELDPPIDGPASAYAFDAPASHLTRLAIATSPGSGIDLDGDGTADNAFGELFGTLEQLLGQDINALLDAQIQSGDVALGMSWHPRQGAAITGEVELHMMHLKPSGVSTWAVSPESFLPGTRTPAIRAAALVQRGRFLAGPTSLELLLPVFGAPTEVLLQRVLIRGALSTSAAGVTVTDGELTGYVSLTTLIEAINTYTSSSERCACLHLTAPLVDLSDGLHAAMCTEPTGSTCEASSSCQLLAAYCEAVLPVLIDRADHDIDGDGRRDAMSAWIEIEAEPATFTGLAD